MLLIGFIIVFGLSGVSTIYFSYDYYKYKKKKREDFKNMRTDLKGAPLHFTDELTAISDISPGDHIYTGLCGINGSLTSPFRLLSGIGYHHGIYLGNINGVLRVADFGRRNETHPVIGTLDEFMCGYMSHPLCIRCYTSGYTNQLEDIIEQAFEMEGEQDWGLYDWVENNCEHFATFLKTGKKWSSQVYKAY